MSDYKKYDKGFINYAHRGASEYLPENTLLSFYTGVYMKANGIDTILDLCRLKKTDWLRFRNGGKKSLTELDDFLTKHGLEWGMEI